jgi:hypothetical protein
MAKVYYAVCRDSLHVFGERPEAGNLTASSQLLRRGAVAAVDEETAGTVERQVDELSSL